MMSYMRIKGCMRALHLVVLLELACLAQRGPSMNPIAILHFELVLWSTCRSSAGRFP